MLTPDRCPDEDCKTGYSSPFYTRKSDRGRTNRRLGESLAIYGVKLPVKRRLEDLAVNDFARRIAWHSRGFIKVAKWRTSGNQQVDDSHGENFSDQKLLVSILPFETNEHSVNVLEYFELLRGCRCHVAL